MITYLISGIKRRERIAEQKMGHKSFRSEKLSSPSYYEISSEVLASEIGVSVSTATRLKQLAYREKFIELKSNLIPTNIHVSH